MDRYITKWETKSMEDMHNFFKDQKDRDIWRDVPLSQIEIKAYPDRKETPVDAYMNLYLSINGEEYPVHETAWKSLIERCKIYGAVLTKLKPNILAEILDTCLRTAKKTDFATMLIRDRYVQNVASQNYVVLPMSDVIEIIEKAISWGDPQLTTCYTDDTIVRILYEVRDAQLLAHYKAKLKEHGLTDEALLGYKPCLLLQSSDVGMSCVTVSAMIVRRQGDYIRCGSCFKIDHDAKVSLDTVEKAASTIFSSYKGEIERLTDLLSIELEYPVAAMKNAAKKLRLPKKPAAFAIDLFEGSITSSDVVTAHDVYIAFQEVLYKMRQQPEKYTDAKIYQVGEDMTRLLHMEWGDFDYPSVD